MCLTVSTVKVVNKSIVIERHELKAFPVVCCISYLSVFTVLIWNLSCQSCGQLFLARQIVLIETVLYVPARKQEFTENYLCRRSIPYIVFFKKVN